MSLYWKDAHVAVNIVDDPQSPDFDRRVDPSAKILELSYERMANDPEYERSFAQKLAQELGCELPPETPEWCEAHDRLREHLLGERF